MFLTHKISHLTSALCKSSSLSLGLLVVVGYLCLLHAWSTSHEKQHQLSTLKVSEHVGLLKVPHSEQSNNNQIIQIAGSAPAKFLSFDDFMSSYTGAPQLPASDSIQPTTPSISTVSTEASFPGSPKNPELKSDQPAISNAIPSTSLTDSDDFSAFMQTQPQTSRAQSEPASNNSAELLIKKFTSDQQLSLEFGSTEAQIKTQTLSRGDVQSPRLLIAETAQSLGLPQGIVNEIVREETSTPGGLRPEQVRKLMAMMLNEATQLHEAGQKREAGRLAKFALFIADEASLTNTKNDPELISLLYLGRTFIAASYIHSEIKAEDAPEFTSSQAISATEAILPPVKEQNQIPEAKPSLPEVHPQPVPPIVQHAKANEAMVLPGYAPPMQSSNIQHPFNQSMHNRPENNYGNNPFQAATYTNDRSKSVPANDHFQSLESLPSSTAKTTIQAKPSPTTSYLAFPDSVAPAPPTENSVNMTNAFSQEITSNENGIVVQDHLVEIPEHISYGVMLGMFLMIILLLFRRR